MFIPAGFPGMKQPSFREGLGANFVGRICDFFGRRVSQAIHQPSGFLHIGRRNTSGKLEDIPIKKITPQELVPNIDIPKLTPTSKKIRKVEVDTPWNTDIFDTHGYFVESLKKGTKMLLEPNSPIFVTESKKTGKIESYIKIRGCIYRDTFGNESIDPKAGYIHAPWLNGLVQKEVNQPKKTVQTKNPEKKEVNVSFSGYLGPDGREIPAYILRSVTINYFGKVITPKLQENIMKVDEDIMKNRTELIAEVTHKKIPLEKAGKYKAQIETIKKKKGLTEINRAIQSLIGTNDEKILHTPTIVHLIRGIQKTPEWQRILQQAAFIDRRKRFGRK